MVNKSPLRYPGGKTRACKVLDEAMCERFNMKDFDVLVSPFFGGGSFEFFLQTKYDCRIVANDKFEPLYNFWSVCKSDKSELVRMLYEKAGKITSEIFKEYRDSIMGDNDRFSRALKYFSINRCSFSGSTLSGGYSSESNKKRFTTSSVDRVGSLDLENVEFSNLDFSDFLSRDFGENSIIFLDPPYYLGTGSKLYGQRGDIHESFQHDKLEECLRSKKNWVMTYNDCEYVRNLYSNYEIVETAWSYGMNSSKKSSEIIIIKKND
mgnify:CR=1 FL=1|tara:strand:- start:1182 stop:1976 length:795 start_codon:yes stop_codon:yes gene_type:complete